MTKQKTNVTADAAPQDNDLGLLTYFRGSNVWVKPTDMRAIASNLNQHIRVPDLRLVKARRAVRAARSFSNTRIKVEAIANGAPTKGQQHIAFGILRKEVDAAGKTVGWVQFDRVDWSYSNGWVAKNSTPEAAEFITHAELWQTHLDYGWVRAQAIRGLGKCDAIPLPGGGVFYIHSTELERFERVRELVKAVSGAKLVTIQVDSSSSESREAIADAAQDNLNTQIADVQERLDAWKESAGRASTLENMLEELATIKNRASALALALQFGADNLNQQLDELDDMVNAELSAIPTTAKSRRLAGGAIADGIVKVFEQLGDKLDSTLHTSVIAKVAEENGWIEPTEKSTVATFVAVKLAGMVASGDPRFERVSKGTYRYTPHDPDAQVDPDAHEDPEQDEDPTVDEEPAPVDTSDVEIPGVDELETMSDGAFRKLAKRLGLDPEETPDRLVSQMLAIREQRAASA